MRCSCGHQFEWEEAEPLEHRVFCGDSTKAEDVRRVTGGEVVDVIVTDPPYCSGGFQEAGRAGGSVGTTAKPARIHNDTLSSRGFQALIKAALSQLDGGMVYIFTDWRMWLYLFDVVEASGYGVRNMIVWDKGSPGMGRGWRTQHELVMFGSKAVVAFDNHKAQGNVIACARTGNVQHTTEKPIELVAKILAVTDMAHTVADPFLGSGTTLIACEQLGRQGIGIELEPKYVAVALQRLADMGLSPELAA